MSEEIRQILLIYRREQYLRRTANPKPCQFGKRLVRQQPPTQIRHRGFKIGRDVGEGHGQPLSHLISSWPGLSRPSTSCRISADWSISRGSQPSLTPFSAR